MNLILAVLEKKLKIPFYNCDVYVNVVGGLNIQGPVADLGVALALISSSKNTPSKLENMIAIGEIGLTGEVRPIMSSERIVNEAYKMGFNNVILPKRNKDNIDIDGINIVGVKTLREALNSVF